MEPARRTARRTPSASAQWLAGDVYFTSSPAARKARDLAVNPLCTISVRMPGIDLVLDGAAAAVTDPGMLEQVAAGYRAGGWPAQVDGDAFTAPFSALSAGPPHRGRRRDQRAVWRDALAPPALAAAMASRAPPARQRAGQQARCPPPPGSRAAADARHALAQIIRGRMHSKASRTRPTRWKTPRPWSCDDRVRGLENLRRDQVADAHQLLVLSLGERAHQDAVGLREPVRLVGVGRAELPERG